MAAEREVLVVENEHVYYLYSCVEKEGSLVVETLSKWGVSRF